MKSILKVLRVLESCLRTTIVASTTSIPIPSPGMEAMRYNFGCDPVEVMLLLVITNYRLLEKWSDVLKL